MPQNEPATGSLDLIAGFDRRSGLFLGALVAADAVVLAVAGWALVSTGIAALLHVMLVAGSAAHLLLKERESGRDLSLMIFALLLVLVAGPVGGICVLGLNLIGLLAPAPRELLEEWYQRISGIRTDDVADLVHNSIAEGREFRPAGEPLRLMKIARHGSVSEKQALLGLIGLKYHPDYLPMLLLALRAKEPSVRAQAAAVFVKMKERYSKRLRELLEKPREQSVGGSERLLELARDILECAGSGFIDPPEAKQARSVVKGICESALAVDPGSEIAHVVLCRTLAAESDYLALLACSSRIQQPSSEVEGLTRHGLLKLGRYRELGERIRGIQLQNSTG